MLELEQRIAREVVNNNATAILFQVRRVLDGHSDWQQFQIFINGLRDHESRWLDPYTASPMKEACHARD